MSDDNHNIQKTQNNTTNSVQRAPAKLHKSGSVVEIQLDTDDPTPREKVMGMWRALLANASKKATDETSEGPKTPESLRRKRDIVRKSLDAEQSRLLTLDKEVKKQNDELLRLRDAEFEERQKLVAALEKEVDELRERNRIFEDLFAELAEETPGNDEILPSVAVVVAEWGDTHEVLPTEIHQPQDASQTKMTRKEVSEWIRDVLNTDDYDKAVEKPVHTSTAEWHAIVLRLFMHDISLLWEALSPYCTPHGCPVMSAGAAMKYLWQDAYVPTYKKPTPVSASQYINLLIAWVQRHTNDENIFVREGEEHGADFVDAVIPKLYRRLFRVYAHVYHNHFNDLATIDDEWSAHLQAPTVRSEWRSHLNASFKHFVVFSRRWKTVNEADFAPLKELIKIMGTVSSNDKAKAKAKFFGQKLTRDPPTLRKARAFLDDQREAQRIKSGSMGGDASDSEIVSATLTESDDENDASTLGRALREENERLQQQIADLKREREKTDRFMCTISDCCMS